MLRYLFRLIPGKTEIDSLFLDTPAGRTRADIMRILDERPRNANQLTEVLDTNYRDTRRHLETLQDYELIRSSGDDYGAVYLPTKRAREHEATLNIFSEDSVGPPSSGTQRSSMSKATPADGFSSDHSTTDGVTSTSSGGTSKTNVFTGDSGDKTSGTNVYDPGRTNSDACPNCEADLSGHEAPVSCPHCGTDVQ